MTCTQSDGFRSHVYARVVHLDSRVHTRRFDVNLNTIMSITCLVQCSGVHPFPCPFLCRVYIISDTQCVVYTHMARSPPSCIHRCQLQPLCIHDSYNPSMACDGCTSWCIHIWLDLLLRVYTVINFNPCVYTVRTALPLHVSTMCIHASINVYTFRSPCHGVYTHIGVTSASRGGIVTSASRPHCIEWAA